jgi:hypothetical protein
MTHTETHSTDVATYSFAGDRGASRSAAWAFMHACDAAGLSAGFPSLSAPYTVQVGIVTCGDRETADALAGGATVVAYAFKGTTFSY